MTAQNIMEKFKKEYYKARRMIPDRRHELAYVQLAVDGNRAAKQTLIYKYIPFLYAMALRLKNKYSSTPDELVNAAIFGFEKALREFDKTRGTSFYTFYAHKAANEMRKESYSSLLVHRSETMLKCPRDEELETVACISIDRSNTDGHALVESIADDGDETTDWFALVKDQNKMVDDFISDLPPVEKRIVREMYLNNPDSATLNEVGNDLGLCRERVRQLKNRALDRIRNSPRFNQIVSSGKEVV